MLTLTPIGTVRNEIKTPILQGWGTVVSDLVLDEGYTEGLDGIEDYSHVIVIFWMDQAGPPKSLKRHVQSREDLPVAGLFARRGPSRPNPIDITAVQLLRREKNERTRSHAAHRSATLRIEPISPSTESNEALSEASYKPILGLKVSFF